MRKSSEGHPPHNLPRHKGLQGKSPMSWSRLPKDQSPGHDHASPSGQSRTPKVRCWSSRWAPFGTRGREEAGSWGSREAPLPSFPSSRALCWPRWMDRWTGGWADRCLGCYLGEEPRVTLPLSLLCPDNGYRQCLANGSWAARVNYSECQEILSEEVRLRGGCHAATRAPSRGPACCLAGGQSGWGSQRLMARRWALKLVY